MSTSHEGSAAIVEGIAHDLSNLLTVISGHGEAAQARVGRDDELYLLLERIKHAAAHAADLTHRLASLDRDGPTPPAATDLNRVIREVEPVLRGLMRRDIELDASYAEELGPVAIEPIQVERVLLNLVLNARDAMPDGGRLTMRTDDVAVADHGDVPAGAYSRIRVKDTGIGMSAELEAHAFDRFVTTKVAGTSRGLGLATVRRVIADSNGYISMKSTVGAGTRFDVYLPRVDGETGDH